MALAASLLLAGCVALPAPRSATCAASKRPTIVLSQDGRTASTRLDVLTYNVEGLPNSLRSGRPSRLREIGARLAELRRRGEAPDVVMFQEVFSRSARAAVRASGYPTLAPGPSALHRPPRSAGPRLPGRRNPRKGELSLKLASSGLVIASEYPMVAWSARPFGRSSCAGIDCLSNKGLAMARIAVPGLPAPIDLYTTHMNSTHASRVNQRRHFAAHARQAREIGEYLDASTPAWIPLIFAGDFNMRSAPARFETFTTAHGLELVHTACLANPDLCEVELSWDGDAPWLDTQDLQLFASSNRVHVRPVRVSAMFDGSPGDPKLSDHDGLRVTYELSWPSQAPAWNGCGSERL